MEGLLSTGPTPSSFVSAGTKKRGCEHFFASLEPLPVFRAPREGQERLHQSTDKGRSAPVHVKKLDRVDPIDNRPSTN